MKNAIEKFKSLIIKPYEDGQDVSSYQRYFLEQYSSAFGNNMLPFMHNQEKLFDSYFRLRKFDDIKNFNDITEYGPPSPVNCKSIGRANLPYNPVFYCSLSPNAAIGEMKKWHGSDIKCALSKWKKRDESFAFMHIPTFSSHPEIRQHAVNIVNKNVKGTQREQEDMLEFLIFLGDQFLSEKGYSVSASLAHQLIHTTKVDVLSYPSVIDMQGVNFAFSPQVVSNNILFLDRVYILEPKPDGKSFITYVGLFNDKITPSWHNITELKPDDEILLTMMIDFKTGAKRIQ